MQELSDEHMRQSRECSHALLDHMIETAEINGHKPVEIALDVLFLIAVNLMAAGVSPQLLTETLELAQKHAKAFKQETLN